MKLFHIYINTTSVHKLVAEAWHQGKKGQRVIRWTDDVDSGSTPGLKLELIISPYGPSHLKIVYYCKIRIHTFVYQTILSSLLHIKVQRKITRTTGYSWTCKTTPTLVCLTKQNIMIMWHCCGLIMFSLSFLQHVHTPAFSFHLLK